MLTFKLYPYIRILTRNAKANVLPVPLYECDPSFTWKWDVKLANGKPFIPSKCTLACRDGHDDGHDEDRTCTIVRKGRRLYLRAYYNIGTYIAYSPVLENHSVTYRLDALLINHKDTMKKCFTTRSLSKPEICVNFSIGNYSGLMRTWW